MAGRATMMSSHSGKQVARLSGNYLIHKTRQSGRMWPRGCTGVTIRRILLGSVQPLGRSKGAGVMIGERHDDTATVGHSRLDAALSINH